MSQDGKTASSANNDSGADSAKATGKDATALGYGSEATEENTTAIGNNAKATAPNTSALGQNAKATAKKSVALGQNAQAKAENTVALGADSVADEPNTVSVGSVDKERRVTNVAPGVKGTDAVNVNQLNQVKSELRKADKKLRGGIAGATAIANIPQVTQPGANVVGVGVGNYNGQSAVAVGYSKLSDNNKVIFKMSGAATTQGDFNVGAGIGYQWK
ncbi:adhesin [Rodentibacter caecimuris]|uniref:Adhesin n=1 Tax=Rodentibacter caecimuris TaxID=1796644 RepID=A0A1V3KP19_9PAST|nr:adhesin [Rodentibacter heylii]